MDGQPHFLLIGGAGETPQAAAMLAGHRASVVWAGGRPAGMTVSVENFEHSDVSLASALQTAGITHVLDCAHGFERQARREFWHASQELGLPHAALRRPDWQPDPGDRWVAVKSPADAVSRIPGGGRIFAVTGRTAEQVLSRYQGMVFLRRLGPEGAQSAHHNVQYIHGDPAFSEKDEVETFQQLGITDVLLRNTGGDAGRSKLDAAQALKLRIWMIDKPDLPFTEILADLTDIRHWIARMAGQA